MSITQSWSAFPCKLSHWANSCVTTIGLFSIDITKLVTQVENLQGKALQDFVIDKIYDLKGQDIIALDVQGKSSITDCMTIFTGTSSRHGMSIAYHVVQ